MRCEYCGENEAGTQIPNPNGELGKNDSFEWDVCIPCKKVISLQQKLSMLHIMKNMWERDISGKSFGLETRMVTKYNKMIKETEKEIDHVTAEDGQKACTIVLRRKQGHE